MNDLIGKTTQDGWQLNSAATFPADHTGGYFSNCFHVTRAGQRAFLKALNLDKFGIQELMVFFSEFKYEQDTLAVCRDKSLSRIVRLLESGSLDRGEGFSAIQRQVPFIVFEDCRLRETMSILLA